MTATPELAAPPQPELRTVRVLPSAPTDAELGRYEHREVWALVGASSVSIVCLGISQVRFAALDRWLVLVLPALAFTMLYYAISLVTNIRSRNVDLTAHRRLVEAWAPPAYPTVDVLLPICNEGLDVLVNTWRHVAAMAEHYRGEVAVHVLDDGDSRDAARAAASFGFRHTVRPDRGWFKKAGNLRHGYSTSSNDYVVVFDADFCPREDFLDQLLPYADADPGLGIVQSPQYFRVSPDQTRMERGAAAVQELFYRLVQVSRDQRGGAICVGSCAVYRRTALDSIGGTALIEHSEDVHTGFDLGREGWRLRYVPVPLATGVCPDEPDAFLTQQYRWCAGSMSLLGSKKFWRTRLPLGARLCYFSGFFYYLHTAIFTFVTPLIPLALIVLEPSHVLLANLVWILPSTVYSLVIFPLWNRVPYGPSALMARLLYGWAHVFAVVDTLRGKRMGWQVTGRRTAGSARSGTHRMWRAIQLWGGLTCAAWMIGATVRAAEYGVRNWAFLWLTGALYTTIYAMALWSRHEAAVAAPGPEVAA